MSEEVLKGILERMRKASGSAAERFNTIRTGRANLEMLDGIEVDCYETKMAINQVANVGIPEARLMEIRVWDPKVVPAVEKAIVASDLGINPSTDGSVIRLKIPPLNEERREEMVKKLHVMLEEGRVAIRNVRRDANEEVKAMTKDKKLTEDERDRLLTRVQEATDKEISELEKTSASKEQEIRAI